MTFSEWFHTGTHQSTTRGSLEYMIAEEAWNEAINQVVYILEDYGTAICGCEKTTIANTKFYDQLADDIRKRFLTTN